MADNIEYSSLKSSSESLLGSHNNEVTLKIMQYNVQMLKCHMFNVNWWKRGTHVIDHVITLQKELEVDVIVFNEIFFKRFYHDLKASLATYFPYSTPVVSGNLHTNVDMAWKPARGITGRFHFATGGIVIFSKYPIMETYQLIFNYANGIEKFSSKGAVLAKIIKNGQCFNVVGTHFQSGSSEKDHMCRMKQGAELAQWIRSGFVAFNDSSNVSYDMPKGKIVQTDSTSTYAHKMAPIEHMDTTDMYNSNAPSVSIDNISCSSVKARHKVVRIQKLPRGVLSVTDPLIYAGDFNIRFEQDQKWLLALLDADCLNSSLALNTKSHMVPNYDSSSNDYCRFGKAHILYLQIIFIKFKQFL